MVRKMVQLDKNKFLQQMTEVRAYKKRNKEREKKKLKEALL